MKKLRLGIVGTGYSGQIVVDARKNELLEEYELAGVLGRNGGTAGKIATDAGCKACKNMDEFLELKPDYIVEAASVVCVKDMTVKVLSAGCDLVVLSIGAFADSELLEQTRQAAREHGTRVYIASGAMDDFNILQIVFLMNQATVGIETRKGSVPPRSIPLYEEHLMTNTGFTNMFNGNTKEATALLPAKVNVAVATPLATTGSKHTSVPIHSIPGMVEDDYKITAEIEGVKAMMDIYSNISAVAGWSVIALPRNLVSLVVL